MKDEAIYIAREFLNMNFSSEWDEEFNELIISDNKNKKGYVYFIKEYDSYNFKTNNVKIGYTDNFFTLIKRLDMLQTGNPNFLYIDNLIKGSMKLEKNIHKMLKEYSLCGEWFFDKNNKVSAFSDFCYEFNQLRFYNGDRK